MRSERVTFENARSEKLSGLVGLPLGPARAWALFAHCFTCSKSLAAATNIARSLTEAGIAVLRFDFTGLGQSEGEFADTSFSSNVSDLVAAARFLESRFQAPSILVGHSLGGTAVLQAAAEIPSAVAVATIGSPADPAHVRRLLAGAEEELDARGEAEVQLGGRPFRIRKEFLDDLERHDLPDRIGKLRKALLFMHAPLDGIVDVENAARLFVAARHPKSFVSLDTADHLLAKEIDSRYAGRVLAAWASRYLAQDRAPAGPDPGEFEVAARTPADSFRTEVLAGGHRLTADEPEAVGGSGLGPTPYELLSAALATCTSMTLGMYARRKEMALESATVRVRHAKVHATDCADCETREGKIDVLEREVVLEGELTEAQRQRLLEIADRCPVHRTLHGEIQVRTRLAG